MRELEVREDLIIKAFILINHPIQSDRVEIRICWGGLSVGWNHDLLLVRYVRDMLQIEDCPVS